VGLSTGSVEHEDGGLRSSDSRSPVWPAGGVHQGADGGVHIADLKTSKSKVRGDDLPTHPQLGVYQVAVREGALESLPDDVRDRAGLAEGAPPVVAGAELVMLRLGKDHNPDIQAPWLGRLVAPSAAEHSFQPVNGAVIMNGPGPGTTGAWETALPSLTIHDRTSPGFPTGSIPLPTPCRAHWPRRSRRSGWPTPS